MGKKWCVLLFIFIIIFGGFSSASAATTPRRFLGGFFSNALSALLKWLWSLPATTKTAVSGRPSMKFESGYTVETVFDGSKLGIEPFSVKVLATGELLVLDSGNSNIYKMSLPLSRYSRPRLVAGSAEGYSGHVDGKPREARLNHPKGFTMDYRGNIYVADTMNMAIRKISDTGVTTVAGGRWNKGGGHVDGPSEDAKFSNDFEVVFIGSSCSLLVVDRGNQAIREIQLHFDDCAYEYGSAFPLGIAVLVAAAFFGYMLALLQRRVGSIISSKSEETSNFRKQNMPASPYQKPLKSLARPPLIPVDREPENQEGFRKKPQNNQHHQYQQLQQTNSWPMQESFVIPNEDEPPSLEAKTPRKTYAFMAKDPEKTHKVRLGRAFHNGWDGDFQQQQQQQHNQPQQHQHQHQQQQQQQHQQRHYSAGPHTYYEQSGETSEIIFGAAQEQDRKQEMEIKAINYGDSIYDHHRNIHSRVKYMGYTNDY
ncbi:NHL domain-containing protein [Cinnamomum micranthum f. kanehirae]|uniref:NHL domain-containing protein n=1 Tax=Cinnamomum micranthum f. kanehirae TaxID=337451 RepID=A0A3S3MK13_9MAGN|nr:NHL domain-containing protein [Cinnamomum micranthum f. kanehirae]